VSSHGIGLAGAAINFEELIKAEVIIRVGTAGSYVEELRPGDLIVASCSAVRAEGVTKQLVPKGVPSVGDLKVTQAIIDVAKEKQVACGTGMILCF